MDAGTGDTASRRIVASAEAAGYGGLATYLTDVFETWLLNHPDDASPEAIERYIEQTPWRAKAYQAALDNAEWAKNEAAADARHAGLSKVKVEAAGEAAYETAWGSATAFIEDEVGKLLPHHLRDSWTDDPFLDGRAPSDVPYAEVRAAALRALGDVDDRGDYAVERVVENFTAWMSDADAEDVQERLAALRADVDTVRNIMYAAETARDEAEHEAKRGGHGERYVKKRGREAYDAEFEAGTAAHGV